MRWGSSNGRSSWVGRDKKYCNYSKSDGEPLGDFSPKEVKIWFPLSWKIAPAAMRTVDCRGRKRIAVNCDDFFFFFFFLNPHLRMFVDLRERGRGKERRKGEEKRERWERNINWLPRIHTDPGLNPQPSNFPWPWREPATFLFMGWCSNQLSHSAWACFSKIIF